MKKSTALKGKEFRRLIRVKPEPFKKDGRNTIKKKEREEGIKAKIISGRYAVNSAKIWRKQNLTSI